MEEKDCSYKEMTKSVGGQSMPSEVHEDVEVNKYEKNRKSFYGPKGFDWSDMKKEK